MDSDYVQNIRYKLQKRLKRLNTADFQSFHWVLLQTWGFLRENEITRGILDDLERRSPETEKHADLTLSGKPQIGSNEAENDAISFWVVKKSVESPNPNIEIAVGRRLSVNASKNDDAVEAFRLAYVEPLFDYLDEQIDDKRLTLALLKKYKHRCEWFRRIALLQLWGNNTQNGEKVLASDLYEYLHDQGLQFHIEPESAAGRVDLVSAQSGKDRLIADAKIFNPDGGQTIAYLAKGFRQLYDYTKEYNEPFGFLVIFKTGEHDLSISTPHQEGSIPFVTHNNKTIFIVVIDIFEYGASASKRGKLKAYELTPEQLVEVLVSPENVDGSTDTQPTAPATAA